MNSILKSLTGILLLQFLLSCQKELSCENCSGSNKSPVAIAGADQIIFLPADSARLDGSTSYDPDGKITTFQWRKISGPVSLNIIKPSDSITKIKNLVAGVYQFELKVTDNSGISAKDTMSVTVIPLVTNNHPPAANAGPDQAITLPVNSVTLDGSASTDPDNNITGYAWTKISGPATFNIANANAVQTPLSNLVQGIYKFELTVTDAGALFSKDTVQVFVNAATVISCSNRPLINATLVPIGSLSDAGIQLASAATGNKIFFAGGQRTLTGYSSRVDIYDISSNTWATAELSSGNRLGMATATVGTKILFAGGMELDNGLTTSRVDIYDASTNSWSTTALSKARSFLAAATVGSKVFFAGGGSYEPSYIGSTVVDIYDNATNTWSTATLSKGRFYLSANTVGSKIYFAGGSAGPGMTGNASTRIDIYDASTNSWSTDELQEAKSNMASIAVGNTIYWSSGWNGLTAASLSDQVEIKDVTTGISTFACAIPRTDFYAVVKDDNIVFFTGNSSDFATLGNRFDIYNTTSHTWSTGLLDHKIRYTNVISVNNTIYIAGGTEDGSTIPVYSDKVWKLVF